MLGAEINVDRAEFNAALRYVSEIMSESGVSRMRDRLMREAKGRNKMPGDEYAALICERAASADLAGHRPIIVYYALCAYATGLRSELRGSRAPIRLRETDDPVFTLVFTETKHTEEEPMIEQAPARQGKDVFSPAVIETVVLFNDERVDKMTDERLLQVILSVAEEIDYLSKLPVVLGRIKKQINELSGVLKKLTEIFDSRA